MPKMKTKSGAKKRFRVTGSGKIRVGTAYKQHNLRKRSKKMRRQARGTTILQPGDTSLVMHYMPYARS